MTKPSYTPAQIAAKVIENMKLSAPSVDLNALADLKQLENTMIETLREMRLVVPLVLYNPTSKH